MQEQDQKSLDFLIDLQKKYYAAKDAQRVYAAANAAVNAAESAWKEASDTRARDVTNVAGVLHSSLDETIDVQLAHRALRAREEAAYRAWKEASDSAPVAAEAYRGAKKELDAALSKATDDELKALTDNKGVA